MAASSVVWWAGTMAVHLADYSAEHSDVSTAAWRAHQSVAKWAAEWETMKVDATAAYLGYLMAVLMAALTVGYSVAHWVVGWVDLREAASAVRLADMRAANSVSKKVASTVAKMVATMVS
jgi:hypothetical protein